RTDTPDNIRLVAYIVPTTTPAPTVTELRDFLAKTLPAYMIPAAFVTLEQMPLMPNSKINRTALPAPDHSRPELAATFIAPQTEKEQHLADIWQSVLGLEEVGIHDDFFELGGDSILSIQVIARANEKGLHLTPRQFFEGSTIGQLAAAATDAPRIQAEQGVVTGPLPLTPIQHWFFEQDFPQQHHWNQAMLFALAQPLQPELLETAVSHLIQHHDALRLRFNNTGGVWQQYNAGLSEIIPVTRIDLSNLDADAQKTAVSHHAAIQQTTLDLKTGPLLRIVTFDCGDTQPDRLLIAVHHLAIDGVSWRILLEDLQTAYAQLQNQMAVSLPPKTTSYQQWAERLLRYAASPEAIADLSVWQQMAKAAIRPLPRDFTTTHMPSEATSQEIVVSLNATETEALLRDVPATYRTEINDVLLTALARTMHTWTHSPTLLVDMEGHGRSQLFEDVDLSRTVGWFTTVYPIALTLSGSNNPGSELKQIKEQLRRIPDHGIGYGILRYLGPETAVKTQLANIPQAEISFNYLGQFQQAPAASDTLTIAPESRGSDRSLDGTRQYLLDVSGGIHQGQLHITWIYSPDMHQPATIKRLANNFINALRDIITHCQEPETSGATPSDFPMAQLDQKKLDKLMAKMARRK
ncbi:MAG: non-ribosomal peptide synthetase, partial [Chloroflexi bacterium]